VNFRYAEMGVPEMHTSRQIPQSKKESGERSWLEKKSQASVPKSPHRKQLVNSPCHSQRREHQDHCSAFEAKCR
jgi:hypothetical protein